MVKSGQRGRASNHEDECGYEEDHTPCDKEIASIPTDASYLAPKCNHLSLSGNRLNNFVGGGIAAPHVPY
jgi:hypothetical protein